MQLMPGVGGCPSITRHEKALGKWWYVCHQQSHAELSGDGTSPFVCTNSCARAVRHAISLIILPPCCSETTAAHATTLRLVASLVPGKVP